MTCISYLKYWFKVCCIVDAMSYAITVSVTDGTATVATSGEVPGGEFTITGHEDQAARHLTVSRRGPDGRYVQTADSVHYKDGE